MQYDCNESIFSSNSFGVTLASTKMRFLKYKKKINNVSPPFLYLYDESWVRNSLAGTMIINKWGFFVSAYMNLVTRLGLYDVFSIERRHKLFIFNKKGEALP